MDTGLWFVNYFTLSLLSFYFLLELGANEGSKDNILAVFTRISRNFSFGLLNFYFSLKNKLIVAFVVVVEIIYSRLSGKLIVGNRKLFNFNDREYCLNSNTVILYNVKVCLGYN